MRRTTFSIFKNHTQAIMNIAEKEPVTIAPDCNNSKPECVIISYELYERLKK